MEESKNIATKKSSYHKEDNKIKRNIGNIKNSENNSQNGNSKSLHTKNYSKCKWIKFSNQKS